MFSIRLKEISVTSLFKNKNSRLQHENLESWDLPIG